MISGPASVARNTPAVRVARAGGENNTILYARIYARKSSNNTRSNASRTSKRRVSGCIGMSWRRNEPFLFVGKSVLSSKLKMCHTGASQNEIDDDGE